MTEESKLLTERAMLVSLRMTGWSGRKMDDIVSDDVAERAGAAAPAREVGSYSKRLIVGESLSELSRVAGELRRVHMTFTMPWDDRGVRLLPVSTYGRYVGKVDTLLSRHDAVRAEFLAAYPGYIEEARVRLGSLFLSDDYPAPNELDQKITAGYSFSPIPSAEHFVVSGLMEEQAEGIRDAIIEQTEARLRGTILDLWDRLSKAMTALTHQLDFEDDGSPRPLHSSTLDNLRDIAVLIPDLNVTDDASLNSLAVEVADLLAGVDVQDLRANSKNYDEDARVQLRDELADARSMLSGYFG